MGYGFKDRVVLITGASSGIGRASALRFARQGARLMLAGRSRERLELVAREAEKAGGTVRTFLLDVADEAAVKALVRAAEEQLGPVDIAVASAGQYVREHASTICSGQLRTAMEVNFFGTAYLFLALLPGMLRRRQGHFVAVSSVDGKKALPRDAPYVASKFAVTGFLDSVRQDLRGTGITISTILPARVDTPMVRGLRVPRVSAKIPPDRVARAIERAVRRKRRELVVPFAGPKLLIVAGAFSPRLADWLIRLFGLEGEPLTTEYKDSSPA